LFSNDYNDNVDKREQNTSVRVFSLEEEHKRLMKQLDIDNFSLSRIPRPGEINNNKEKETKKLTKVPKPNIKYENKE
jgi:hypothetical protein